MFPDYRGLDDQNDMDCLRNQLALKEMCQSLAAHSVLDEARIEALEKWGREVVEDARDFLLRWGADGPITVHSACLDVFKKHYDQARILGLVEE